MSECSVVIKTTCPQVKSGYISTDTHIVFRSLSAFTQLFIQVMCSKVMRHYFEKYHNLHLETVPFPETTQVEFDIKIIL